MTRHARSATSEDTAANEVLRDLFEGLVTETAPFAAMKKGRASGWAAGVPLEAPQPTGA
jgi:hypothetical protein